MQQKSARHEIGMTFFGVVTWGRN